MSHQLRSSKNFTDSYPVGPGNHEAKSCMDIAAHIAHPWCACGHHLHSARICLHGWITHDAGRPRRRELMEWGESLPSYVFMVIVWRAWLSTSVWFPCLVLLLRMWGITARKSWSRRETEVGKVCFKQFWAFPIAHFFIGENVEKSSNFQAGRQSCARRRFTLATVKPPVKNGDGLKLKIFHFPPKEIDEFFRFRHCRFSDRAGDWADDQSADGFQGQPLARLGWKVTFLPPQNG